MTTYLTQVLTEIRNGLRSLRHAPLFTALAVTSMAFGIGANTAVFTLVDQVLLRKLAVDRPNELVQVSAPRTESYGGGMGDGSELSYAMYRDLRDHNSVFSAMSCRLPWALQVGFGGRTEQVLGEMVSGSFFPMLGVDASIGRILSEDDDRIVGGHPVAVLSHAYWLSRFGGDRNIIGKTITVNRQPLEIIGVVEPGFAGVDFGTPAQVYVPISMQPRVGPPWLDLENRRFRFVQVFARLRPGVTREAAEAGLQPLYRSVLEDEAGQPAFARASADTKQRFLEGRLTLDDASRGHSNLRTSVAEPLVILLAVAGGVLLIVCANVANLLIARGAARRRELAVRLAIGASRGQIVRLLVIESLLVATAGAAMGVLLATWGADLLLAFYTTPENGIAIDSVPDGRILLFTCALAAATALLAGVFPAYRSTRVDLAPALKGTGGGVVGEQPTMRKALVVAQVAMSFLLLVGAGLFVNSLRNLMAVDPGFRTERMLTFTLDFSANGYEEARAREFARTFHRRLSQVPGVVSAGYAFQPLLTGGGWGVNLTVEGYQPPPGRSVNAMANAVSPGFFKTMDMRLLAGREFEDRDDRGLPERVPYSLAVVNETFARRYLGGANPVGRRIGFGSDPGTRTNVEIVGLVGDTKYTGVREEIRPQVFFPYLQATVEGMAAYIRTNQDPALLMGTIRREVAALDPQLAIYDIATLDERVDRSVVNERLVASLSGTLSAMATLLSVVGLYGVLAYTVARRTREIGIRMALGALGAQIAGGVLREAGLLVVVGLAFGLPAAWWLGRYVEAQLYGVTPADPATILTAAAILALVAGAAALLPARRAASIAPMAALRDE